MFPVNPIETTSLVVNPFEFKVLIPDIVAPEETTISLIVAIPVARLIWDGNLELFKVPLDIFEALIAVILAPDPEKNPAVTIPDALMSPSEVIPTPF